MYQVPSDVLGPDFPVCEQVRTAQGEWSSLMASNSSKIWDINREAQENWRWEKEATDQSLPEWLNVRHGVAGSCRTITVCLCTFGPWQSLA